MAGRRRAAGPGAARGIHDSAQVRTPCTLCNQRPQPLPLSRSRTIAWDRPGPAYRLPDPPRAPPTGLCRSSRQVGHTCAMQAACLWPPRRPAAAAASALASTTRCHQCPQLSPPSRIAIRALTVPTCPPRITRCHTCSPQCLHHAWSYVSSSSGSGSGSSASSKASVGTE